MSWLTGRVHQVTARLAGRWQSWRRSPVILTVRLLPGVNLRLTVGVAASIIATALMPIVSILASGSLAGSIAGTLDTGLGSPAGHRAIVAVIIIGLAFTLARTSSRLTSILATALGNRLDRSLQQRVFRAINEPASIRYLDDPATQDAVGKITGVGVASYTPGSAINGLASRCSQTLQGVFSAAILAGYRWWLAILVLGIQLLWARQRRRSYLERSKVMTRQTRLIRRSDYFRDLSLTPQAAKEIQLFGLSGWLVERFRDEWLSSMKRVWQERRRGRVATVFLLLAVALVNLFAYIVLSRAAVDRVIGLGALVIYVRAVFNIATMSGVGRQDFQVEYGTVGTPSVLDLEAQASRALAAEGSEGLPSAGAPRTAVRFDNVRFTYPSATRPALDGLNLEIPAGRSLALVGANGAGKTTLIKLLCRLYEPDSGTISVDGAALSALEPRQWQRQIAAIFQDFIRYELTVRDNIAFGAPEHAADDAALRRAARRADALEQIERLPGGWDTPLARHLAGGAELSGGEWQRIALARALFAAEAGARILILDEPAASLDVRAEAAFYDRFLDLTRDLTTIVVSHRFSTVRQADLICVLDQGKVGELGTHDELIELGGAYAEMFALQSARFVGGVAE